MEKKLKSILVLLGLSSLLSAGSIVKNTWVPVGVNNILTFVPHTLILPDKDGDGIEDALDTPTAYAQDVAVDMNSDGYSIVLNGTDNDSAITYTIVTQPTHGVLSGTAPNLTYIPSDGFQGEDSFTFVVSDGVHTSQAVTVSIHISTHFGLAGTHEVSRYVEKEIGDSIVYYPSDISTDNKTPLIFFLPGYQSQNHESYQSLLNFIASHGYSVIYAKDYWADTDKFIERFEKMLDNTNDVLPYVDTTRIGVIGHSSGGGDTFKILDHFSKKGYGENGRFLMSLDGWFASGMNSKDMKNLPSNTNVVMQRYHDSVDGDALKNTQDPRITLSEYTLLTSIANDKKDYQVFSPATHGYPAGNKSYDQMQGLLKPLDALMDYTFNGTASAQQVALENGSDTPYADGLETIREKWRYTYRCNSHKNRSEVMEIDYCNQYLGGKNYPQNTIFDDKPNANPAQPANLSSYVDPVFNNKVTRITDRANQSGNAHSYPKTQSWNADSSLIRLGYRIYYADNFSETPITENILIRGSLTEMKWSSYEPDVFYGMDVRGDRFVFMKAKINEDNTITYSEMPHATFMKSEYDELKLGKYEGNLDHYDNYAVFSGRKKDTNRVTLMVYHLKDNYGGTYNKIESNITTEMKWYTEDENGDFTTSSAQWNQMFDWASMSALGNYVIVNYRSKKGDNEQEYSIEQYYKNLHHVRTLAHAAAHGDLGVDANGKEVFVEFGFGSLNGESNLGIWMYPLDGSPRVQLLPDKYNGGHISCRNYQRPGWCYVNTRYLDTRDPDNIIGVREVFAVKLDNSHTVQRFAQTHNSKQNAGCTQVNVSPDGTQVLFASDWNVGSAEDYQWDADHYMGCNDPDRKIKIDTYHVKVENINLPLPIQTIQATYDVDETVSITVDTPLSGDQDWVGIYKSGDSSDWVNVIAWNWVEQQGNIVLNKDKKPMPAGEYEIRLFFHNSTTDVKATYSFTVVDNTREFGTEGPYLNKVRSIKTSENDEVISAIYYVEGEVNLPTIIFMSGWKSDLENYDGFLKYVTSLGFCVIAQSERGKCFSPNVYEQNLTTRLHTVHDTYNADITKLGMIGHSSGGGTVHYLMDYFKKNNIAGNTKSVAMSLDGWFPFGTTKELLNNFDTPTLLMQFGGYDGINQEGTHPDWDDYAGDPYHHYQDPKINLAIFKLLTHANLEKEYIVLEANNNHSYVAGNYDTILTRQDLLAPIDEFLNHTLGTGDAMNLMNQYDDVILNDLVSEYRYYCHTSGFNFCDLDNLVFP